MRTWPQILASLVFFSFSLQSAQALNILQSTSRLVIGCKVALQLVASPAQSFRGPTVKASQLKPYSFSNSPGREPPYEVSKPKKIDHPIEYSESILPKFRGLVLSHAELQEILRNGLNPTQSSKFRSNFGDLRNAFEMARVQMLQEKFKQEMSDKIIVVLELTPEAHAKLKEDRLNPQFSYTTNFLPPASIKRVLAWNPQNRENWELVDITQYPDVSEPDTP